MSTNNSNGKRDWDKADIGVLWQREQKNGSIYFTGKVKVNDVETEVVIFSNKNKYNQNGEVIADKIKHPDFRIYLSEKREQSPAPVQTPAPARKPVAKQAPSAAEQEAVF